jgi:deoxyadenosine/deoxycytidine kinase
MNRLGFITLLENFQINPFLKDFYSDAVKYAFETEISFILQHYHQIKREHADCRVNICDFSFVLDLAYAEIGLRDTKLKAFQTISTEIERDLPPPALLIHLKCDASIELGRIRNRGRAIEESINLEFLEKLNKAVERHVENAQRRLKVITIDSAKNDFANDEAVKQEMLALVSECLR